MDDLSVVELDTPPDDFLPDEPEGAAFHKAFQAARITGFDCRYLAILRQGVRVAIVPYFTGIFNLGTLLPEGLLKKCINRISFRYACVGHPSTDIGLIDGEISADILTLVNATLSKKSSLIAYKNFHANLPLQGFVRARGYPLPVLALKGDYYSGLDGRRRNDFKHKLAKIQSLRIEECSNFPEGRVSEIFSLYMNTYEHASIRFEQLTPEYFQKTASISRFLLFFEADKLIGFAQIIGKNHKAVFKYVGMDYLHSRQYGLYYGICLKVIEACLKGGYQQLDLGVTSYHFKHLLGSDLIETSIYYRHHNPLVNWLMGKFSFLIEPDKHELQ